MKITDEMIEAGLLTVKKNYRPLVSANQSIDERKLVERILASALSASPAGVVKPQIVSDLCALHEKLLGYLSERVGYKTLAHHDLSEMADLVLAAAAELDRSARIMSAIEPAGVTMTMQPLGDEFQAAIGDREGLYEPAGVGVETEPRFLPTEDGEFNGNEWDGELSPEEQAMIDAAWEKHKSAGPVAKVINDNQHGRTAIIEILRDPPTLDVGTLLFTVPASLKGDEQ